MRERWVEMKLVIVVVSLAPVLTGLSGILQAGTVKSVSNQKDPNSISKTMNEYRPHG